MNVSGYAGLAFATGLGIPVMAALNGGLSSRLGSPFLAGLVLFLVGAVAAACVFLIVSVRSDAVLAEVRFPEPSVFYLGGAFVAFYVLSITWLVPRFGVGNAVFFVLLGQIVAAAMLDHFGLLGVLRTPVTFVRAAGILTMLVGILLATKVGWA